MARAEHLISSNRMAMRILTLPEAAKDKTPKVISAHEIGIGEGFNMGTFEPDALIEFTFVSPSLTFSNVTLPDMSPLAFQTITLMTQ